MKLNVYQLGMLLGIIICLSFLILVSGCLQTQTPEKNETNGCKISKEDAENIALNDSNVIARIGNHSYETEEAVVAVLNEKEVYLVNVRLYKEKPSRKLFGLINVFITYDGKVETVGWEYPSFIPTSPNNDK